MSAIITGAVVGAVIASSAVHSGPSEPMSQSTAIFLLVLLVLALSGGGVCAYLERWAKVEAFVGGAVVTAAVICLVLGVVAFIAVAFGAQ